MQKRFSGVVVPVITPLNKDFTVDITAVGLILNQLAQNNIDPLVLGTTGESSSINEQESLRFVQAAVTVKGTHQTIYAGLVGNQVSDLIKRGNQYIDLGADVVVATLPAYYILTPEQMEAFYIQLADHIKGPVMLYNIKATTQMSIPLAVVERLSKHPNIWGLKDSERDIERMTTCIETYRDREDFSYFCGWGAQSANSLQLGADGIVPSTGNIVPSLYGKMKQEALLGNWDAVQHYQELTDIVAILYQQDRTLGQSLAALKVMMHGEKTCNTTMMPPLTELSARETELIIAKFDYYKKRTAII
ncbi:dihydrodipicolinate synthase family protein [Microbacter margulisiae]|uniref:4-hydroxy-tetrahydrodipicolinate synthase n=1 Tax=Microbacter margulisiae TaxID=1350067 RepID=A0A7W5H0X8_9PORP|nr:dihydrodipicolinate synthase family protein [Microbacter margulisiae]MBB3186993.1 4-hydroxy-tetrahydrodipicolinate synthase [Microbacter margulisiae]